MTTSRPVFDLPVNLHDDAIAQVVEHEHLLRLRQAELPGTPACFRLVSGDAPVPPS